MNLSYGDLARAYHGMREWDKADSLYHVGIEKMRHDTLVVSNLLSNYAKMKTIQSEPDLMCYFLVGVSVTKISPTTVHN